MPFRRLRQLLVATVSVALAVGLLPLVGASSAEAAAKPRRFVSGWAPYWGMPAAMQSIDANQTVFASVNGFWHSATSGTNISDTLGDAARAEAVAHLHAAHIAVYGTVTDQSGTGRMAAVLRSPSKRLAHVRALVTLAVTNQYDGIDLDYEGFAFHDSRDSWAKTRPAWVTFIRQLSSSLHAHGKKLTVTTPAIYDAERGAGSGYWVYDWHGIAQYADQVRIMAYDYSVSHVGPIAPIAWVQLHPQVRGDADSGRSHPARRPDLRPQLGDVVDGNLSGGQPTSDGGSDDAAGRGAGQAVQRETSLELHDQGAHVHLSEDLHGTHERPDSFLQGDADRRL